MAGTYSVMLFHIVFSTKERTPWIDASWRDRLYAFMGGVIRDERGVLYAAGGIADHVHLLVRWRPDEAASTLLRNVKARSSKWIHDEILREFAWQEGYSVFSVSRSRRGSVESYIRNQERHHRGRTFEEKIFGLLDAHGLEYDPQHVLG